MLKEHLVWLLLGEEGREGNRKSMKGGELTLSCRLSLIKKGTFLFYFSRNE
jgi:hypothetical protein